MNQPKESPALASKPGLQNHFSEPVLYNNSAALSAFRNAMESAGIGSPEQIEADGDIHRFRGEGDKPGYLNCWYVLHLNGRPAGAFGSWRLGFVQNWMADGRAFDPSDAARFAELARRAKEKAAIERQQRQQRAAHYAGRYCQQALWADAAQAYLIKKAVHPYNLRQSSKLLLVPLTDLDGELWNLQTIAADGTKRFQPGGRVTGLASIIGDLSGLSRLLICEGWATGATLHSETGAPVLCAMNCGNLLPVAKAARYRWPHADIVVCGDDDRFTPGNPGRSKATEAAEAIGARLIFPTFAPGESGSDFNDMAINRARAAA